MVDRGWETGEKEKRRIVKKVRIQLKSSPINAVNRGKDSASEDCGAPDASLCLSFPKSPTLNLLGFFFFFFF